MAIKAAIPTPYGVPTLLWKICHEVRNYETGSIEITLAGYLSDDPKAVPPIRTPPFTIRGLEAKKEPSRSDIYKAVKAHIGLIPEGHELAHLRPLADGEEI